MGTYIIASSLRKFGLQPGLSLNPTFNIVTNGIPAILDLVMLNRKHVLYTSYTVRTETKYEYLSNVYLINICSYNQIFILEK